MRLTQKSIGYALPTRSTDINTITYIMSDEARLSVQKAESS